MAAGEEAVALLLQVLALFAVAKAFGWVVARFGQPSVVGELAAGVLVGPSILGWVDPGTEALEFAGRLGAILLLFEVGLETNFRSMVAVGRPALIVAVLGIGASFLLGYGGSYAIAVLGYWENATILHIFVGATLTATSVGITARVLAEMGALQSDEARIILGAAVLDDVGGLLILAVVSSLAAGAFTLLGIAVKAGIALGFLGLALALGLLAIAPAYGRLAERSEDMALPAALAWALLMSILAAYAGLDPIIGAFTAGLVLAGSAGRDELHHALRPLNTLFVPLFFATVGARVDVRAAAAEPVAVAVVVALLTVLGIGGKLLCAFGVRKSEGSAWIVGIGMVPRGEVGLIFAFVGLTVLGIADWMYAAIVIVVMLTTLVTPPWLAAAVRRVKARAPTPGP